MKHLNNKKQNNVVQNSNKGEKSMIKSTQRTNDGFDRKLSTPYQQDLIELVGYIYFDPKKHSKESLAYEFTKNGKQNERKVQRMVRDVNAFCPYIKRVLNDITGRVYYYIDKNRFTETDLDNFYKKSPEAPLLYIFLKSLLVKPMTTSEIMQKVNVNKKTANSMIEKILDTSYHVDAIEKDGETILGEYWKWISKLIEDDAA